MVLRLLLSTPAADRRRGCVPAVQPRRLSGAGVVAMLLLLAPTRFDAAEPVIRNINLRGLQIGGTTSLVIDGDNFGKSPRLLLSFPVQQQLNKDSADKQAKLDVALGTDAVPGYYHLRVVTDGGVSAPVAIAVDRLPQRAMEPARLPKSAESGDIDRNGSEVRTHRGVR